MRKNPNEAAWNEARKEHAAAIIDFLEMMTNGNWRECLDVAEVEHANTGSALWLAVCDGLRTLIRQEAAMPSPPPSDYPIGDDELPF